MQCTHRFKDMHRQIFNCTTTLWTDNVWTPAIFSKAIRQTSCEGKCRVTPQVVLVRSTDVFRIIERLHWIFDWIVRNTQQETRRSQTKIASIFRFTQ
ncbi:Uncharacterised protein [Vibrio cholerae]|nr:Uncharacterised protein [Vibrio cholerae]